MRHTFDQTSGSPQWWFTCRLKSQVGTNCLSFETLVVIIININSSSSSSSSSWMVRKKSLDTLHTLPGRNHFQHKKKLILAKHEIFSVSFGLLAFFVLVLNGGAGVSYKTACVMRLMKSHNTKPVNVFV